MARKKKHPEHINHERWLVSYADFITLLFAFFVVMFAVSQVDSKKMGKFSESFSQAVGVVPLPFAPGGKSLEIANQEPIAGEPGTETNPGSSELATLNDAIAEIAAREGGGLGGVKLIRGKNELVIRLSDSVIFDSGDDRVKDAAVRALRIIADEVRKREVALRVEGHTDNVPIRNARFRSNWELSTARATAVIAELAERGNLAPERLSAAGYGQFHPVAENDKPENRAQNRRVDLVITPIAKARPAAVQAEPKANAPAEPKPQTEPKADAPPEPKPQADAHGETKPQPDAHSEAKPQAEQHAEHP